MQGLKNKRKQRSLTLAEVSKGVDVSIQSIYNYEHGFRFPRKAVLDKLCAFFDCTIDELL